MRIGSAVVLAVVVLVGSAVAQERVIVSARDLIQRDHVLEVAAGTEVIWADPHFDRVWLPSSPEEPTGGTRARRLSSGVRADR